MKLSLLFVAFILSGCAITPYIPQENASSVQGLVRNNWGLKTFNFSEDIISSTYKMRVSTYSSPYFIHLQQMQKLSEKSVELKNVCEKEGGIWIYDGLAQRFSSQSSKYSRDNFDTKAAEINAKNSPVSIRQLDMDLKSLDDANKSDLINTIKKTQLERPDTLTESALSHAEKVKWLGKFSCNKNTSSWKSVISFSGWKSYSDSVYLYKEVVINTKFYGLN